MKETVHNDMAMWAFSKVGEIDPKDSKEFRSLARSFPSMLQVNGLGMALAFLYSKKSAAHKRLYMIISEWIKIKFPISDKKGKKEEFMKDIVGLDSQNYRIYTNEIMNLCLWIKRFAEGLIEGE